MKWLYYVVCSVPFALLAEKNPDVVQELSRRFSAGLHDNPAEGSIRSLKNVKELEVSLNDLYPELAEEDMLQVDEEELQQCDLSETEDLANDGLDNEIIEREDMRPKKCHQHFLLKQQNTLKEDEQVASLGQSKPELETERGSSSPRSEMQDEKQPCKRPAHHPGKRPIQE